MLPLLLVAPRLARTLVPSGVELVLPRALLLHALLVSLDGSRSLDRKAALRHQRAQLLISLRHFCEYLLIQHHHQSV